MDGSLAKHASSNIWINLYLLRKNLEIFFARIIQAERKAGFLTVNSEYVQRAIIVSILPVI